MEPTVEHIAHIEDIVIEVHHVKHHYDEDEIYDLEEYRVKVGSKLINTFLHKKYALEYVSNLIGEMLQD